MNEGIESILNYWAECEGCERTAHAHREGELEGMGWEIEGTEALCPGCATPKREKHI